MPEFKNGDVILINKHDDGVTRVYVGQSPCGRHIYAYQYSSKTDWGIGVALLEHISHKPKIVKKEGWINIYSTTYGNSAGGGVYPTKEEADNFAGHTRTACIKIEWEEEEK